MAGDLKSFEQATSPDSLSDWEAVGHAVEESHRRQGREEADRVERRMEMDRTPGGWSRAEDFV